MMPRCSMTRWRRRQLSPPQSRAPGAGAVDAPLQQQRSQGDAAAVEADSSIVAAWGVAPVRGSRGVVTLRNTGTTALFYRWVLADTAGDPNAQPQFAQLPYSGPRPGMLLPGESRRTAFRFAPTRAGAASELWAVQCAPDLAQGPGEAVPMVMLQGSARMTQSAAAAAASPCANAAMLAAPRLRPPLQLRRAAPLLTHPLAVVGAW